MNNYQKLISSVKISGVGRFSPFCGCIRLIVCQPIDRCVARTVQSTRRPSHFGSGLLLCRFYIGFADIAQSALQRV